MISLVSAILIGVPVTRTPILTYHDIIEKRDSKSVWFDCTASELQEQIQWLKKQGAVFVSLDQVYDSISKRRPLPKNAVAITFADNYESFYLLALPILLKHRVPVTQFAHTGFIGNRKNRPKMSASQMKACLKSGLVRFGSQTVTHPADLTKLSDQQIETEFRKSKDDLARVLGVPVLDLAYPNGKFDQRVASFARRAGYRMAFTEDKRPLEKSVDQWQIPRYVHTRFVSAWRDGLEQKLKK